MGADAATTVAWHEKPIGPGARGREVRALAALTPEEFALFVNAGRFRRAVAGEVLFRRGAPGGTMHVVVHGAVDLDFGADRPCQHLVPSMFFGEMGLLLEGHSHSATAKVPVDATLLEVGRDAFNQLVQHEPGMVCQFLRRAVMRAALRPQTPDEGWDRSRHALDAALVRLRATAARLQRSEVTIRTDALTGLANRRGLVRHLVERDRSGATAPLGLLLLNCDGFKAINDRHGPDVGDRVLQSVASLLRAASAPGDLACRLDADDFALLVQATRRDEVTRIAEFVLAAASDLQRMGHDPPLICNLSIGACLVRPGADVNDWYACADAALYRAKCRGGHRVEWQDTRWAP